AMVIVSEKARRGAANIFLERVEWLAARTQRAAKVRGEVTVLLASGDEVRALNRRFRGKDQETDVLSFPAEMDATAMSWSAADIAISLPAARRQAREQRHGVEEEIGVLLLHGMLHLAGMDHERDHGQMRRTEERLRRSLGLGRGLIARGVVSNPLGRKP